MSILRNYRSFILVMAFFVSSIALVGITNSVLSNTSQRPNGAQALPVIHFSTNVQTTNTLQNMINDFNANFSTSYGFTVQLDQATFVSNSQHDTYVADFQNHSSSLDVISMDVIWPSEFASHGYILPLNDVFNSSYQSQFLQAPIEAETVNGSIYGVPWFHDSAMLYYRSDVLSFAYNQTDIPYDRAPETWNELSNWTLAMLNDTTLVSKYNITSGFVWQGKSYEGLMCDFMEYLGATGTYSFLNSNQTAPLFNSSSGINDALAYMKNLIDTGVSPNTVLTYDEELSRAVWNAGNAIFMRNWPYAYALSLNSPNLNGSLVTGAGHNVQQFNVTTMPVENTSVVNPRTSCLGGWQLGVNTYSNYPTQAKKFILWLTSAQEQLRYFLGSGDTPTLKALYNNSTILNSPQSYVHNFLPIFESSLPRPVSPLYTQMSGNMTPYINAYLGGTITLSTADIKLQGSVQGVINQQTTKVTTTTATTTTGTTTKSAITTPTTTTNTTPTTTTPTKALPATSTPTTPTISPTVSSTGTITASPGFGMLSTLAVLSLSLYIIKTRRKKK